MPPILYGKNRFSNLPRKFGFKEDRQFGLNFNSDNDFFVGVNVGVRHSQIGLTTLSGEILAEDDFETPSEPAVTVIVELFVPLFTVTLLLPPLATQILFVIGLTAIAPGFMPAATLPMFVSAFTYLARPSRKRAFLILFNH